MQNDWTMPAAMAIPKDKRGGDILLADSTIFTTLFGGAESLEVFWRNLASLRVNS